MVQRYPEEIRVTKHKLSPIPFDLKKKAIDELMRCLALYASKGLALKTPSISFDLKGSTGGKAYSTRNHIQLNAEMLVQFGDAFIEEVVPHELAHLAVTAKYGLKVRGHGVEWKTMMSWLNKVPNRTHKFETVSMKEKKDNRPFLWCNCAEPLRCSTRIYNLIKGGQARQCAVCKARVSLTPKTQKTSPTRVPYVPGGAKIISQTSTSAPTDKMLAFAMKLSKEKGISVPTSVLSDKAKLSGWITANTAVSRVEVPTDKQLDFAMKIAAKNGVKIPADALRSKAVMSDWLSSFSKK